MRKAMTILGVLALGGAISARAEEKKQDRGSKLARAMAVAQIDFDLHRAQLGFVGSSLASERPGKPETARQAEVVARAMAVAQIDFDLHREQLGLVGSSLLSEHDAKTERTSPAVVAKAEGDRTVIHVEAPTVPVAISEPRQ